MAQALVRARDEAAQQEKLFRAAQAYERRWLTQELHDSLAQQVFYLHLGLDQLCNQPPPPGDEAVQRKLLSMRDVAADVYEQIRHNLSMLRAWEQVNITEAINELGRIMAHNEGLSITMQVQGQPEWLSPHTSENVYSIVREALNNVIKHARAGHVDLELHWSDDQLSIELADDGIGFDPATEPRNGHYGLMLMRETVEALGGELRIDSSPGAGARLQIDIPLHRDDADPLQKLLQRDSLQPAYYDTP